MKQAGREHLYAGCGGRGSVRGRRGESGGSGRRCEVDPGGLGKGTLGVGGWGAEVAGRRRGGEKRGEKERKG